eukprot:TRINITY_DN6837_c0_g1_i1.p1 TRINITY_DN6837_c0_g1~~TRINITY_DN6837_c0_g1_i1.p1  ORF type:complete len:412 (+),score=79.89 TRINITY_DN6837_c0_g1_i1:102-1337(+)
MEDASLPKHQNQNANLNTPTTTNDMNGYGGSQVEQEIVAAQMENVGVMHHPMFPMERRTQEHLAFPMDKLDLQALTQQENVVGLQSMPFLPFASEFMGLGVPAPHPFFRANYHVPVPVPVPYQMMTERPCLFFVRDAAVFEATQHMQVSMLDYLTDQFQSLKQTTENVNGLIAGNQPLEETISKIQNLVSQCGESLNKIKDPNRNWMNRMGIQNVLPSGHSKFNVRDFIEPLDHICISSTGQTFIDLLRELPEFNMVMATPIPHVMNSENFDPILLQQNMHFQGHPSSKKRTSSTLQDETAKRMKANNSMPFYPPDPLGFPLGQPYMTGISSPQPNLTGDLGSFYNLPPVSPPPTKEQNSDDDYDDSKYYFIYILIFKESLGKLKGLEYLKILKLCGDSMLMISKENMICL